MTRQAQADLAHPSDRLLWRLIAGDDLTALGRQGIERHLDGCSSCVERLQDLGTRGIAAELVAHGEAMRGGAPGILREMGLTGPVTRVQVARALVGLSIPYLLQSPEVPLCLPEGDPPEVGEQRAYLLLLLRRSRIGAPLAERVEAVADRTGGLLPGEPEKGLDVAGDAGEAAVALAPRDPYALACLGWVAAGRGSLEEAEAWWKRIRGVTKNRGFLAGVDGNLGTLAYCRGDLETARKMQSRAMRGDHPYVALRARMSLAVVLVEEGSRSEARACLEEIEPAMPRAVEYVREMLNGFGEQLLPLVRRGSAWHTLVLRASSGQTGEGDEG